MWSTEYNWVARTEAYDTYKVDQRLKRLETQEKQILITATSGQLELVEKLCSLIQSLDPGQTMKAVTVFNSTITRLKEQGVNIIDEDFNEDEDLAETGLSLEQAAKLRALEGKEFGGG